MQTEVIQINNTLGLNILCSGKLKANEFNQVLLQNMDHNNAFISTCSFIVADFSDVTEHDLTLDDVTQIAIRTHQEIEESNNLFILTIATKSNTLYNLFSTWKEILSDSKNLQMGVFKGIERTTQWTEIKVSQSIANNRYL